MKIRSLIAAYFAGQVPAWHDRDGAPVPGARLLREYAAVKGYLLDAAKPGALVAVSLDHDYPYLLCVLACMELGLPFLPLRPDWPRARLAQIESLSRWSLMIDRDDIERIVRHAPAEPGAAFPVEPAAPLYVMCTSGSTGEPKAVVITRSGYEGFLDGLAERLAFLDAGPRLLFVADFTVDASLHDVGLLLLRRGSPFFSRFRGDVFQLAYELETFGIEAAILVPGTLRMLLRPEVRERASLSSLRCLVAGGAVVTRELYRELRRLPDPCRVFNCYGPTEMTVWTHGKRLAGPESADLSDLHVSVGAPLAGVTCRLQGAAGEPITRPLEAGELLLAGAQLMAGYLNRPELTRASLTTIDGTVYYRTGDLAFFDRKGEYYIVGRAGETLKRRGYRVNLNDIDSYVRALPGVEDCVTVALPDPDVEHVLVSCVVPREPLSEAGLREEMKRRLLGHQIPDRIEFLDRLPVNDSGKVDRAALERRIRPEAGAGADEERTYRRLLAGLLLPLVLSVAGLRLAALRWKDDDVAGALDLSSQTISSHRSSDGAPVVLLGGSEMTGMDVPDQPLKVYDLATIGGNVLTSLAYLKLSLAYRPSHAIVSVAPDAFEVCPAYSAVALSRPDLLEDVLPGPLLAKLQLHSRWRSRVNSFLADPRIVFHNAAADSLHRGLWLLRYWIYGRVGHQLQRRAPRPDPYWEPCSELLPFSREEMMALVPGLLSYASRRGVKAFIVLPPLDAVREHPEYVEVDREFRGFLDKNRVPYLDHRDLFLKQPELFEDGFHLDPAGRRQWARRLADDVFGPRAERGKP